MPVGPGGGTLRVTRETELNYVWFWKKPLGDGSVRKGDPCRVLSRGAKNTILVEFEDGYQVTTSRYAVRLAKE